MAKQDENSNKLHVKPGEIGPWLQPSEATTLQLATTREDDPRDRVGLVTLQQDSATVGFLGEHSVVHVSRPFCLFGVNDYEHRVLIARSPSLFLSPRKRPDWVSKLISGFLGGIDVAPCPFPPAGQDETDAIYTLDAWQATFGLDYYPWTKFFDIKAAPDQKLATRTIVVPWEDAISGRMSTLARCTLLNVSGYHSLSGHQNGAVDGYAVLIPKE